MSSFPPYIMVFKMHMVMSTMFLVTMMHENYDHCVFTIGDECQSICNDGNPTKATALLLLRVEVLKMVTTNDDEDLVVIWL